MNNLTIELENKYVILTEDIILTPPHSNINLINRLFKCVDGPGCSPYTSGQNIFGKLIRIDEELVERLATGKEIEQAKRLQRKQKMTNEIIMRIKRDFMKHCDNIFQKDHKRIAKDYELKITITKKGQL